MSTPEETANTHTPCCSAHGVDMDCETYRRTHFVEVGRCCKHWPEDKVWQPPGRTAKPVEPTVTITAYEVSCLPEGIPGRKYYTLNVRRSGDLWTIEQAGEFLTMTGEWLPTPVVYDSVAHALAVAGRFAPKMEINGITVEQAIERGGVR